MTLALPREPAPAPPSGFRPHMGLKVQLEAVVLQARCPSCNERLGNLRNVQFDHAPALHLRAWDPIAEDTIPPANDPDFIIPRHIDCHAKKTNGAKTRSSGRGSDKTEIARTNSLADSQAEFRRRILAKEPGESVRPPGKIASRPFQSRRKKRR